MCLQLWPTKGILIMALFQLLQGRTVYLFKTLPWNPNVNSAYFTFWVPLSQIYPVHLTKTHPAISLRDDNHQIKSDLLLSISLLTLDHYKEAPQKNSRLKGPSAFGIHFTFFIVRSSLKGWGLVGLYPHLQSWDQHPLTRKFKKKKKSTVSLCNWEICWGYDVCRYDWEISLSLTSICITKLMLPA